jgi:mannose-6-phosphate isomerase
MFYPLKFIPVYKDYLWGGRNLERFGRSLPQGLVAESWEISGHPDGVSIVANGELVGLSLPELVFKFDKDIIGTKLYERYSNQFPLLIKLIDANQKLSVQVHPDDHYAAAQEGGYGKNEMWYVVSAEPGAEIIYDLVPGTTRETFTTAIREDRIENYLKTVPVVAGDVFNIPAGMVHGLGAGIIVAEIQQSSNLTYRLFDYNRTDAQGNKRPLHIGQALEVIDFKSAGQRGKIAGVIKENKPGFLRKKLIANEYFEVDICELDGEVVQKTDGQRFFCYTILEGAGNINYKGGSVNFKTVESILVPAVIGDYIIEGKAKYLKVSIPVDEV